MVAAGRPVSPVTLGTTRDFLDHFGLEELRDLPGLEELKGAGLLSGRIPANFNISMPLPLAAMTTSQRTRIPSPNSILKNSVS